MSPAPASMPEEFAMSLTSRRVGAPLLLAVSIAMTAACGSQQAGAPARSASGS